MLGAVDHRARHDAVLQHAAVAIDVAQEQVERSDALGQAALDAVPFAGGDDARQKIGRDDPLGRLVVVIDGEGDALMQEGLLAGLLAAVQFVRRQGGEPAVQRRIGRPHRAVGGEHLVIGRAQLVVGIRCIAARVQGAVRRGDQISPRRLVRLDQHFMLHREIRAVRRQVRQASGAPKQTSGACGKDTRYPKPDRPCRGSEAKHHVKSRCISL